MNIQTDPRRLRSAAKPCPPAAEEPIRAHFLHDDRLRELLRKYLSENGFLVSTASDAGM